MKREKRSIPDALVTDCSRCFGLRAPRRLRRRGSPYLAAAPESAGFN
jgi:hypothetical protein